MRLSCIVWVILKRIWIVVCVGWMRPCYPRLKKYKWFAHFFDVVWVPPWPHYSSLTSLWWNYAVYAKTSSQIDSQHSYLFNKCLHTIDQCMSEVLFIQKFSSFCKRYLQAHPFGNSYAIYIVDKVIGNLINPFMHNNFMD